jgi:L-serine dehydratase
MSVSVFEIFKIGIGPSSSHTVGPMKAACEFAQKLENLALLEQTHSITIDLYGSLALTGKGHGSDKAVILGLTGEKPDSIDPDQAAISMQQIIQTQQIALLNKKMVAFNYDRHLLFHYQENLPHHTNGMRFTAYNSQQGILFSEVYYSIGGGFIVNEADLNKTTANQAQVPYPFETAQELLDLCQKNQLSISQLMLENEKVLRPETEIHRSLLNIAKVMESCINAGCRAEGILPGGLNVRRRANNLYTKLIEKGKPNDQHPEVMNWLNLYAMAVNEENAAGGRVVTAPTNGAAGIIPAVLRYYKNFCDDASDQGIVDFLLTAAAIAILYKLRASISGAEVGCQGEVGVACSMAAGALAAVLGGSLAQIENAAEIGMEHNLGLPCDPPKGLVQIPCIERNAMGAVKAVNAARLALAEDGQHRVSLDTVIDTMRQIGKDMMSIYKETSLGGLAVNVTEC